MTRPLALLACLILAAPAGAGPPTDLDGHPLPDGALARFGSLRFRTGSSDPHAWALSPDGKTLAIGTGLDVALWDIEAGRATLRFPAADWAVEEVAFSPDGRQLVRVDRHKVSLLDVATGRERDTWDLGGAHVVFPPGTSGFVALEQDRAFAFPLDARRPAEPLPWAAEAPVMSLSPSGRFFLGRSDAGLHLVDARTGRLRCRFPGTADLDAFAGGAIPDFQLSALSPDDRRLYLVRPSGGLLTFDATTGRKLEELDPPAGWPETGHRARIALSPDGAVAYLAWPWCPTHRRDLKAGRWLDPLPAMPSGPLVPHRDGKRLLLIGDDGVIRRYDLATLREIPLPGFDGRVSAVGSPDGRRVAISSGGAAARLDLFDPAGKELWSAPLRVQPGPPRWSADGRLVACAGEAEVTVCAAASGKVLHTFRAPGEGREFTGLVGFNPAGSRLIASLDNGEAVATFPLRPGGRAEVVETGVRGATDISPDGRTIVYENGGPSVALFDVPAGRFRTGWTFPPPPRRGCGGGGNRPDFDSMNFSPDGSFVLSWAEKAIVLWDPVTGEPDRVIETGSPGWGYTALSPDGLWLAVAAGNRVSVWDVSTGQYLVSREVEPGRSLTGVCFAGPGRLVTTVGEHTVLLWDVSPKKRPTGPLWEALAGDDGRSANQAAWALAADPRGPDILRSRIAPAQPPPAAQVRRWIAHLGADEYAARETAMRELRALGRPVEPDLRAALAKETSEEVRTRLGRLLTEVPRLRTADEWVQARAVLALEVAGTEAAREVLAEWAAGAPGARLTIDAKAALDRLAATR